MISARIITISQLDKRKQKYIVLLFSVLAIVTAALGMIPYFTGSVFNWESQSAYIPMAPSTAVCIILLSIVVFLNLTGQRSGKNRIAEPTAVIIVLVYVFLEIFGYMIGSDLNFEKTLSNDWGKLNGVDIGLMSPATALVTILIAGALLIRIVKSRIPDLHLWTDVVGVVNTLALIISFVFTLAYLYGSPLMYNSNKTIPMAFTTAIGFLFLSTAVMISDTKVFPLRSFVQNRWKSYLLRYLMPLSVISVILGGFTTIIPILFLEFNPALLNAFLTIIVAGSAVFISTAIAGSIERQVTSHQQKINKITDKLEISEERYRVLFETMVQGVVYQNSKGEIIAANPAAEEILGLSIEQMQGRTSIDPRWKAVDKDMKNLPGEHHAAMVALQTGKPVENFIQGVFNPKTGDYVWIIVNSVPQYRTDSDQPWQVFSTFLDITERYTAEKELLILKSNLERQVKIKTQELTERVNELEHFHEVTIERELRMEELRQEIVRLKEKNV